MVSEIEENTDVSVASESATAVTDTESQSKDRSDSDSGGSNRRKRPSKRQRDRKSRSVSEAEDRDTVKTTKQEAGSAAWKAAKLARQNAGPAKPQKVQGKPLSHKDARPEKRPPRAEKEEPRAPPTVQRNASRYTVAVSDDNVARKVKMAGVAAVEVRSGYLPTTHPVSAAIRKYEVTQAYSKLHALGARHVLGVQGADWHKAAVQFLNTGVQKSEQLNLTLFRTVDQPRDLPRAIPDSVVTMGNPGAYDAYVFVDFYEFEGAPLKPQTFVDMIGRRTAIWVGHDFPGAFGAMHGEGGWIRVWADGQDYILARSDKQEDARQLHDPLDWLKTDGIHRLADGTWFTWTPLRNVGGMVTVMMCVVDQEPHIKPWKAKTDRYVWDELPIPDDAGTMVNEWLLWASTWLPLGSLLPRRRCAVDRTLQAELEQQFVGRQYTSFSYRALTSAASQKIRSNPDLLLLMELFPSQMPELVHATALAAYINLSRRTSSSVNWTNLNHGENMQRFNLASAEIGTAPPKPWWRTSKGVAWLGAAALVVLVVVRWRLARQPASSSVLAAAVSWLHDKLTLTRSRAHSLLDRTANTFKALCAPPDMQAIRQVGVDIREGIHVSMPIKAPTKTQDLLNAVTTVTFEELIKCVSPKASFALAAYEFMEKMVLAPKGVGWALLPGALAAAAMHIAIAPLPIYLRWPIHMLWNCAAWYTVGRTMTATAAQGALGMWPTLASAVRLSFVIEADKDAPPPEDEWDYKATWTEELEPIPGSTVIWKQFVKTYYESPWAIRGDWPRLDATGHAPIEAVDAVVRREAFPSYDQKELDQNLIVKGELTPDPDELAQTFVYFMLPTNIPVYSPARTDANLIAILYGRLLVKPPLDVDSQVDSWRMRVLPNIWKCFHGNSVHHGGHDQILWEEWKDEWMKHIKTPLKRERAKRAMEHYEKHGLHIDDRQMVSNEVFVKTDEVLLKNTDGVVEMKPRAIVNVDPVVQVELGPFMYAATQRLHQEWPWDWSTTEAFTMPHDGEARVTFGCDATDKLLSEWMRAALLWRPEWGVWILVAGDDSLIVVYPAHGEPFFLEGDFGMFDQSESSGPLGSEMRVLSILGVPPEATARLMQSSRARYIARGRSGRLIVEHPARPMRVTGGADTSIGNSIVNALAWFIIMRRLHLFAAAGTSLSFEHAIIQEMAELGLKLKLRVHNDWQFTSFLKGRFVLVKDQIYWAPAPSRILKVGKSLRDPRQLYPEARGDYVDAARRYLNDIAASYRKFVLLPAMNGFVHAHYRTPPKYDFAADEPWKVGSAYDVSPGTPDDLAGLAMAYGVSEDELTECDALVAATPPLSLLVSPAFAAFAAADYN